MPILARSSIAGTGWPAACGGAAACGAEDGGRTCGVAQTSTTSRTTSATSPSWSDHAGASVAASDAIRVAASAINATPAASARSPCVSHATSQSATATGARRGPAAASTGVATAPSKASACGPPATSRRIATPAPSASAGRATPSQPPRPGARARTGAATTAACVTQSAAYDGASESTLLVARLRLAEGADSLGRLPLRPRVLHRRDQLLHEARRGVHARHDGAGDVALLDLVLAPRKRERELVAREADVGEVRVGARDVRRIEMDVESALAGLRLRSELVVVHAPTILRGCSRDSGSRRSAACSPRFS